MRIIDFFDRGCSLFPDRPFLKDEHSTFTHREVQDASHKIVNGLICGGLAPGKSVVGVLSRNDPRAFICVLGALRSFVWLPLNARNTVDDNISIMSAHDCEWLFFNSEFADEVKQIRRELSGIRQFICVDQSIGEHLCLDLWAESYASVSPYHPQQPNDVSVIWPTGGTTGRSKGVLTTHLNWETMIANFFAAMPYSEPPIHLVVAPMTHAAWRCDLCFDGHRCNELFHGTGRPPSGCSKHTKASGNNSVPSAHGHLFDAGGPANSGL